MKGYNRWKKFSCGQSEFYWYRRRTGKPRGWQRHDGFDEDDYGYDDSYDYSEHYIGNDASTKSQRHVNATTTSSIGEDNDNMPTCKSSRQIDTDDEEWVDDQAATYLHVSAGNDPTRATTTRVFFSDLLQSATHRLTEKATKRERQARKRANAKNEEAQVLLAKLQECGFHSDALSSAPLNTLRVVAQEVETNANSFREAGEANNDDNEGMERTFTSRVFGHPVARKNRSNEAEENSAAHAFNVLPQDCWGVVCEYLTMLPIVRLSSSCTYMRSILEDTPAFYRVWSKTSVTTRVQWVDNQVNVLFWFDHDKRGLPAHPIPRRAYSWSWHLSLRRVCLLMAAKTHCNTTTNNCSMASRHEEVIAVAEEYARQLRQCDTEAWLLLFLHTPDPVVKQFARLKANQLAGMGNIALEQALAFDFSGVDPFVHSKLSMMPSTPGEIESFISSIRVQSLDTLPTHEFDIADATEEVALRYHRLACASSSLSDGGDEDIIDDVEWENGADEVEMSHAASMAAISRVLMKGRDVLIEEHDTVVQNPRNPKKKGTMRARHYAHPRIGRKATRAEHRLRKQMENVGVRERRWWKGEWGFANQESRRNAHANFLRKGKHMPHHGASFADLSHQATASPWYAHWMKGGH